MREGDAHEALSDVRALIGLGRKLKAAQPKLWQYALKLRDKRYAASLVDVVAMTPVLHVSQRFPASRLCAAPILPLARHPYIDSRVLVFDLAQDPDALLRLDAAEIVARLYTPAADLAEGESRIALKEVHLNKCPALIAWDHLRAPDFTRLGIDPAEVERRAGVLRDAGPALVKKVRQVFSGERERAPSDVDASLYDGFIGDGDKRLFRDIRTTPPQALAARTFGFKDPRLAELLFRYRARNWPDTLSIDERTRWDDYRRLRLRGDAHRCASASGAERAGAADAHGCASAAGAGRAGAADARLSEYTFASFDAELAALRTAHAHDDVKLALLEQLDAWRHGIDASLG